MIRLLLHLLKIRDYENCKSCETLKGQLEFSNAQNKELMETILQLTRPVVQTQNEQLKVLTSPQGPPAMTFARRRSLLENMNKRRDEVVKTSPYIAKPDDGKVSEPPPQHVTLQSIEKLEAELSLGEENAG